MEIRLEITTQAGNNLVGDMFFDGFRVTPHGIHCTPEEWEQFVVGLKGGMALGTFIVKCGPEHILKTGTPLVASPLEEMETDQLLRRED